MKRIFHLVSLGCPKNLVDSEVVYGLLEEGGWQGVDDPEEATVLMINTCGFIQPAVEESIDEILQLAAYKSNDADKKLVVIGCLVQRYREKLEAERRPMRLEDVLNMHQLVPLRPRTRARQPRRITCEPKIGRFPLGRPNLR